MESIKCKNEVDQVCTDSPDLKHCWHSPDNHSYSTGMFDNAICCWCGIKVKIHGKFKPEEIKPTQRFGN